ncbi:MAG: TIGR04282 family arsenosugar biosynthesis glycosyltransferase [Betaproteobacteria bacterium]|nr:TIGR04282 family arsenosugar biosynthesis glycosyltransferase [Betaproteobacteria bacterium]
MNATLVIVFARPPLPGRVKTRLIPALGAAGAARLQARLIDRALNTARNAHPACVELHGAGVRGSSRLRALARRHSVRLIAQASGDLGRRMALAIERGLRRSRRVVLIGSDCPVLRPGDLRRAASRLAGGYDAVFAPAEDGGYTLVAMRRASRQVFDSIEWSGPVVMSATRTRLAELGWRWSELPPGWDIDRPEDYRRLTASGLLMRRGA